MMQAVSQAQKTASPLQELDKAESLLDALDDSPKEIGARVSVRDVAAIQELVGIVSSRPDIDQACSALADGLADYLGGRVAIGTCVHPKSPCKIRAISGVHHLDASSQEVQLSTHALEESIARDSLSVWPNSEGRDQHCLRALKQYFESVRQTQDVDFVLAVPLKDEAHVVRGACLLRGGASKENSQESCKRFLDGASPLVASAIGLLQRAEGNHVDKLVRRFRQFRETNRFRFVFGLLVAAIVFLLIPIRYRVKCDCELQPVVRRYVATPFEAHLEKSLVEPGDIVAKGDVLARVDGRDIQWELSAKEAELNRAINERDGRLAAKKSGETKIAALEVERLRLSIDQLQHRMSLLEIRAPVSGIVVAGDHSKSEGVTLQTGQILFEIAPLDEMIAELHVPESEVRFIEDGMTSKVVLDAFPNTVTVATLQRVHPRAELIDHENVFIAELRLQNESKRLRPGMRGEVKISTSMKSIGWIIFHKAIEAIPFW